MLYVVNENEFKVEACELSNGSIDMLRIYDKDGVLSTWARGFRDGTLYSTEIEAEKGLAKLKSLYFDDFKYKPFMRVPLLEANKENLVRIERSITELLSDHENFTGIDFCDVSAGGIQIRGHHGQINGYTYGRQITIKYDFSNCIEVVTEFVKMWKELDTPDKLRSEKSFIADGEKYGWD